MSSPGNAEDAVHNVAKRISSSIGDVFFRNLVEGFGRVLDVEHAVVAELLNNNQSAETKAVWSGGGFVDNFSFDLTGSACESFANGMTSTIPSGIRSRFPSDALLEQFQADGISGIPLMNSGGEAIGFLVVLFERPLTKRDPIEFALQFFAPRTAAEMEHHRIEARASRVQSHLQNRVEKMGLELESLRREMEVFSHSISHDLLAPLRNISGFVDLMKLESPPADESGQLYLDTIANETGRMSAMIDGLLQFSRIGRSAMEMEDLDMDALVREVSKQFETEARGRSIEWKIGTLPGVRGDRKLLHKVFEILISNAVKFTKVREHAIIEVGGLIDSPVQEVNFFVRDNGAGFDMKYAANLFGVFQRLHNVKQFPGVGVGLAKAQRIIHRHGGRIRAEAAVNQGATIFLSLPL